MIFKLLVQLYNLCRDIVQRLWVALTVESVKGTPGNCLAQANLQRSGLPSIPFGIFHEIKQSSMYH